MRDKKTERIEKADKLGDLKRFTKARKSLVESKIHTFVDKQPTISKNGKLFHKPEDLARTRASFLVEKFKTTDPERLEREFTALPESEDESKKLSGKEFG